MTNAEVDILLLNLCDPRFDGRVLFAMVRNKYPNLKTIIITSCPEEPPQVVELIKERAGAILLKDRPVIKIMRVIKEVNMKGHYNDDYIEEALALHILCEDGEETVKSSNSLTRRESEILRFLKQKKTSREIAEKLYLSIRTVENHRLRISKKIPKYL